MTSTRRPATPAELHEYADRLHDYADRAAKTRRALDALQPGFPTSTHDAPPRPSGSVGAYHPERRDLDDLERGSGLPAAGPTVTGRPLLPVDVDVHEAGHLPAGRTTIVERTAGRNDEARRTRERERTLSANIGPLITELYSMGRTWGEDPHKPKIDPRDTDHEWCTNHLRIEACEPREQYKKPDGTYGLREFCRWCNDCKSNYGYTPGIELMELFRDRQGKRLSEAVYRAHHPTALKRGPKSTKRKKGKK